MLRIHQIIVHRGRWQAIAVHVRIINVECNIQYFNWLTDFFNVLRHVLQKIRNVVLTFTSWKVKREVVA